MNFDLIIFDCDGVLVDSEVISCRAHAQTLTDAISWSITRTSDDGSRPSASASAPGRTPPPILAIITTGQAVACDSPKPEATWSATAL